MPGQSYILLVSLKLEINTNVGFLPLSSSSFLLLHLVTSRFWICNMCQALCWTLFKYYHLSSDYFESKIIKVLSCLPFRDEETEIHRGKVDSRTACPMIFFMLLHLFNLSCQSNKVVGHVDWKLTMWQSAKRLVFTATLWGRCYYHHVINEKNKA